MRQTWIGGRCWPLVVTLAAFVLFFLAPVAGDVQDSLPVSISDREFWALTEQFSEPDGYFRSNSGSPDNLLSNEGTVSVMAATVADRVKPGGVYLGVGPEQNFTYIAAMRARIAFITDIRRGNLQLHLLYKAHFEMSADRGEFVSRLFSRKRVEGVPRTSSASGLMNAYLAAEPFTEEAVQSNVSAVHTHLTKTHQLPLSAEDLKGIEYVARQFHRFGPAIDYISSVRGTATGAAGSYARIQSAVDSTGAERTYLATDETFAFLKTMQSRNLIVPAVGDFAGPKALRAIGAYVRKRGATVGAFYVSNVEQYLQRNGVWASFCANFASMPLDANSVFIRLGGRAGTLDSMAAEASPCK
jgi:hypothetical protein